MLLNEALTQLKFDTRMKDWNLNQGLVTEKEIKEKLKNIEDVSENVEEVSLFSEDEITHVQASPDATSEKLSPKKLSPEKLSIDPSTSSEHNVQSDVPPSDTDAQSSNPSQSHKTNITTNDNEDSSNNPWW